MEWSEQQRDIFGWFAQPRRKNLVVRARAGTGKTTTILEAVNHISRVGAAPKVYIGAFNKRIAEELNRRLVDSGGVEAKTLHALGNAFLRSAWGNLKLDNDVETTRIEAAVRKDAGRTQQTPWDVLIGLKKLIGIAKGASPTGDLDVMQELCITFGCEAEGYGYAYDSAWMARIARLAMAEALEPDNLGRITFDDMLFIPIVKGYTQPLYDWVIVDEAQDMNVSQLILAKQSCKPDGHIVVVGDDRQAIYGFRGADSGALDRLKVELDADELGLNTTYRCPASVVAVAQGLVRDFFAAPAAAAGEVDTMDVTQMLEAVKPADIILSRVNAPLVPLCLSLIRRGTGARIEGRDIGKMLASRAKKLKAYSVEDFLEKLAKWANTASSRAIATGKCVQAKLEQIRDMELTLQALTEDCETVEDIYERCQSMFADNEGLKNLVVLSTVHKAKGLEWPHVYLLEDTLYFYGKKRDCPEEQNIHYVAVTRAMERLTLVQGAHAAD